MNTAKNSNNLEYVIPIATVIGEMTMINIIASYNLLPRSFFLPSKPADSGNRNAE
jgi:hypothetical protein